MDTVIPMKKLPYKIMLDRYSQKALNKKTLNADTIVVATVDETNPLYPQKEICRVIRDNGDMLDLVNIFDKDDHYTVAKDKVSVPTELSPDMLWERIAAGNSKNESNDRQKWYEEFRWMLEDWRFVPGGRIMAMLGSNNQDNLTAFNCFGGNTIVQTKDGPKQIKDLKGEVDVLSYGGVYRKAFFKDYGIQNLYEVTLENLEKIICTENHEWWITHPSGGRFRKVTTLNLEGNRIPVIPNKPSNRNKNEVLLGIQNGIVYSDGTIYKDHETSTKSKSKLTLFGPKRELSKYFTDYKITEDENYDATRIYGLPEGLKSLPNETHSNDYWYGFIIGMLATDGCVDTKGGVMIHGANREDMKFICDNLYRTGLVHSSFKVSRVFSPFDGSVSPCYCIRFFKQTFTPEDILRSDHKINFINNLRSEKTPTLKVTKVTCLNSTDMVYCCNEPETHSFVVGTGYLTGNCFVIPCPDDSRHGAIEALDRMTEIMARGGGVGINLSTLRPKHAVVRGVHGTSSGAVSWGGGYSYYTGLIEQGGSRRGALLEGLSVWHPDILEFITVKKNSGEMLNANLSVLITEDFMNALQNDEMWTLEFPDTAYEAYSTEWCGNLRDWKSKGYPTIVYKTLPAKDLWNMIIESNWASAEPGVIWIERYNNMSNSWYIEEIVCTNPCVKGDTSILTDKGYVRIDSVVGQEVNVWNGFEFSKVVPEITGRNQKMMKVSFSDGSDLTCTLYHGFMTTQGKKEARHLKIGDKLQKWTYPIIEGNITLSERIAYTKGFVSGDGSSLSQDLFLYDDKKELIPYLHTTSVSKDYSKPELYGNRCSARIPATYSANKGWVPDTTYSVKTRLDWLAGLIDSDGTLNSNDGAIAIWSSDKEFLQKVKLMLTTVGAFSTLSIGTHGGEKLLPNGKGSMDVYNTCDCYRLTISAWNVRQLMNIGLKTHRVSLIANPNRNASRFITVTRLEILNDIEDKVYCFNEPLRHLGCFNGIVTTNCGEQGLPAWGVCNLGHINLSRVPIDPNQRWSIDWNYLEKIIRLGVRFMDNVIDITPYFFEENKRVQMNTRRIGMGTMGLAELLIKLKIRYGSTVSLDLIDTLYAFIRDTAYDESVELAKEKGAFPLFDADKYLSSGFTMNLPENLKEKIRKYGIRNVALLTQAPTGSTGTMCDTSTGIEPFYDWVYYRRGRLGTEIQYARVIEEYFSNFGVDVREQEWKDSVLPEYFVTAKQLTPDEHVAVMARIQYYTDSSISKTVNCPADWTVEQVDELYRTAYRLGCKGLTIYRDKSRDSQVLESLNDEKSAAPEKIYKWGEVMPKPKDTIYRLVKFNTGCGRIKLMIGTAQSMGNRVVDIYAIVNSEGGCQLNIQGEVIAISKYLRLGGNLDELLENSIKAGNCPSYQYRRGQGNKDLYGKSCFNGVVRAVVDFQNGTLPDIVEVEGPPYEGPNNSFEKAIVVEKPSKTDEETLDPKEDDTCPGCGKKMIKETGCWQCKHCGYSKCE